MQTFSHSFEVHQKQLLRKVRNLEKRPQRQFAYRAAFLTIYGFQIATPVVLGIFLGVFLDNTWPVNHISWTLNFILLGFLFGLYNANMWFYRTIGLKKNVSNTSPKARTQRRRK